MKSLRKTGAAGVGPPSSEVCHLHAALKKYLGYCFYKAAANIRARVDRQLAPFGVLAPQFGMLIILEVHGAQTQAELGELMAMDKATMVRMIDGLEGLKYVTRVPSTQDRRANCIEISHRGRKMIAKMDEARKLAEKEFLKPLSAAEKVQLTTIVAKLIQTHPTH